MQNTYIPVKHGFFFTRLSVITAPRKGSLAVVLICTSTLSPSTHIGRSFPAGQYNNSIGVGPNIPGRRTRQTAEITSFAMQNNIHGAVRSLMAPIVVSCWREPGLVPL